MPALLPSVSHTYPPQFAAKQLNKLSTKCEKNEKLEKKKVKAVSAPLVRVPLNPTHMHWKGLAG